MALKKEQIDHINIINWFEHQYPQYKDDFHHFANERQCNVVQGKILKRMGVKKGVADFFLAIPSNAYHGLWIELKSGKGKLTKEQIQFLERKNERGYLAQAVWGFDASKEAITQYLENSSQQSLVDSSP